jgi:serine O-acetyltransferase
LKEEATAMADAEPDLRRFLGQSVLAHHDFSAALSALLAAKLENDQMRFAELERLHRFVGACDPTIIEAAIEDLLAVISRDPAAYSYLTPFLHFKGFHALQWQRVAHCLWRNSRRAIASFLQSRVSNVFAVDIHPAVPIGRGVLIDHGTSLVIGETAVVGNNVSILHEVTLGGTGKVSGDRHPKIGDGVLLAAGAKVLGNIRIGQGAKVGAGSVVIQDVPAWTTVVGVPAKIVSSRSNVMQGLEMDQSLPALDYSI